MKSIRSIIFQRFFYMSVFTLMLLAVFAYWFLRNVVFDIIVEDHQRVLDSMVTHLDSTYATQLGQLGQLTGFIGLKSGQRSKTERQFKEFLEVGNVFSTLHLYDREGQLLIAQKRDDFPEYRASKTYKKDGESELEKLVEKVYRSKKSQFSEPIYTDRQKVFFHTYVSPVFSKKNSEEIIAILSGGIFPSVRQFDSFLSGLALRKDNFLLVIDSKAHMMSSSGVWKNSWGDPAVEEVMAKPEQDSIGLFEKEEGSFYILKKQMSSFPLTVVLGVNQELILDRYMALMRYIIFLTVFGICIGLIVSIFLAKRLYQPLETITSGIREISSGNYSHRIPMDQGSEMNEVVQSLNGIAENIEKAHHLGVAWSHQTESWKEYTK